MKYRTLAFSGILVSKKRDISTPFFLKSTFFFQLGIPVGVSLGIAWYYIMA
jgi:hypothetical protein